MCGQALDISLVGHEHLISAGVDVLLAKECGKGVSSLHRVGGSLLNVAPLFGLNQWEA